MTRKDLYNQQLREKCREVSDFCRENDIPLLLLVGLDADESGEETEVAVHGFIPKKDCPTLLADVLEQLTEDDEGLSWGDFDYGLPN